VTTLIQDETPPAAKPKSPDVRAAYTARPRNRSKRDGETKLESDVRLKIRRAFIGIRDEHGRATKPGGTLKPPKKGKRRNYPTAPPGYVFGVKPWLRRKEIWWEYNISPRSLRRLEQRGFLHRHELLRVYYYSRAEIEDAIRGSKLLECPDERGALPFKMGL
jgi:hypothetical protein